MYPRPFKIKKFNGYWLVDDHDAGHAFLYTSWKTAMTYVSTRIQLHHLTH